MKVKGALFSILLSTFFTLFPDQSRAIQTQKSGQIVCIESNIDESTNEKTKIGEIIVTLNKEGHPVFIEMARKKIAGLPSIKKTFDIKSKIKSELVNYSQHEFEKSEPGEPTSIRQTKVISAKDIDGRSLVLKIENISHTDPQESSFVYEHSKIEISSIKEFTIVTCKGTQKKTPSI
ncbi:MAG: hypothetical protein JNL11_02815 [Bdellovibrionaceae bacterium]|nr:hypothetical protein [Pseudobdellovibrionaceae bacterium]